MPGATEQPDPKKENGLQSIGKELFLQQNSGIFQKSVHFTCRQLVSILFYRQPQGRAGKAGTTILLSPVFYGIYAKIYAINTFDV